MKTWYAFTNIQPRKRGNPGARRFLPRAMMVMTALCLMNGAAFAQDEGEANDAVGGACSRTAHLLFRSCGSEANDDLFKAQAICVNVSTTAERVQCLADATAARIEKRQLCGAQRTARLSTCTSLGESRYDPNFDPALFDSDFTHLTKPNPYAPLKIGNKWAYVGGGESVAIEVMNETKLIEGVTCIVVRDQVTTDGDLHEDTDDWFCQAKSGNVHYFGEEVKDLESFDGDNPRRPELVSIDGSFKHGRDGDKGGLFFPATPTPGLVYRQEFSPNNAEDLARILTTTYTFGSNPELDRFVPRQLATRLCANNCVVTREYSPLEPGVAARKYYARGIGVFLEVKPAKGVALQLTNCNFDARCTGLPQP